MDFNQENPQLTWWSGLSSAQREIFQEGLEAYSQILTACQDNNKDAQALQSIYLPIVKANGMIPESLQFAELCESLVVNRHQIEETLRELCIRINSEIGTTAAALILWLPPREVRRLIANKVLPATKVGKHWSIATIDVLRLTAKRLKAA